MKHLFSLLFLLALASNGFSQSSALPFPHLVNSSGQPFPAYSFSEGKIKEVSEDEFHQQKVIMEVEQEYYFNRSLETVVFDLIIGGLDKVSVNPGDYIAHGDLLGNASPDSYVTISCEDLNDYLIRMSDRKPMRFKDRWYFHPQWAATGDTRWMSYRPVEDFYETVKDYYGRWRENNTPREGAEVQYYKEFDRIRTRIRLKGYPFEAQRDDAIKLVESEFYNGETVFVLDMLYDEFTVDEYKITFYWQRDFDKYLINQKALLEEIYIYANLFAIDHNDREILVCISDFSFNSDEEIIKSRREEL